ncbi:hypothetical protein AB0N62_26075 [Streptomyces sp. NPDC093982]|uniref:hypothetical protein n=1 Tax=Streptomyces sp. NPDC093982 TaxID=3155077 RepID=UPI0034174E2F
MDRIELSLHQRAQVEVARLTLTEIDGTCLADADTAARMVGRLEVSLRSLLAIVEGSNVEDAKGQQIAPTLRGAYRCPAAHPEDPTPCEGPPVVTVLDRHNAGAEGCAHHGARLLASLEGGYVISLPDHYGAAVRVTKAADSIRPFPWADGPRTRPEQLSRAENRAKGGAE